MIELPSEIEDTIDLAKRLVQISSLSGKEKELALFVKDVLNSFGLGKTHIDDLGSIVAFVKGQAPHPFIVLEGHLDHVPPGNADLWKYPPYSAKVISEKLYGRGTVDMKASLAAMIFAAREIAEQEHEGTLALCFVVHEETLEGTAVAHIIEKQMEDTPDLVILGEPTNLDLGIGHRGRAVIEVELNGRTAHASMPEHGLSALHAASELICYAEKDLSPSLRIHDRLGKASIATIDLSASPQAGPQIPDKARILFDRRFVPGETEVEVLRPLADKVEEFVGKRKLLDGTARILETEVECWTKCALRAKNFFPSWLIEENNEAVRKIRKALLNKGFHANPKIWKFSTDGVYTYGVRRVPTIGFGPGDDSLAHQPNEHVPTKDIERAVHAYTSIVKGFIS